jgi:hypothetical protein
MDPFSREVLIAQHQHDLRAEAEERHLAARIAGPGRLSKRLGALLVAVGEALIGTAGAEVAEGQLLSNVAVRERPSGAVRTGCPVPQYHRPVRLVALVPGTCPSSADAPCPSDG